MSRVARYYSFANYSILASLVYVICIILNSFKNKNILKRTVISSSNYKKVNRDLLYEEVLQLKKLKNHFKTNFTKFKYWWNCISRNSFCGNPKWIIEEGEDKKIIAPHSS